MSLRSSEDAAPGLGSRNLTVEETEVYVAFLLLLLILGFIEGLINMFLRPHRF